MFPYPRGFWSLLSAVLATSASWKWASWSTKVQTSFCISGAILRYSHILNNVFSAFCSTSNQCKLKVAQFAAQLEQYPKAVEIYEEIAKSSLDSNLLRYSVKGYLLNAGLCHLATGDIVNIRNAIDKYQELDLSFSGTRECKFLQVGVLEVDFLGCVLTFVELDVAERGPVLCRSWVL
jgi:hypothetical protein